MSTHGGKREGAGKKKGQVASHTLLAQEAKKRIVERVTADVDTLYNSQKGLAIGSQVLMCKPKKGNTYIVEDADLIMRYIDGQLERDDEVYYFMTLIKPENHAIDSLWDRALGKVPQGINGGTDQDGNDIPLQNVIVIKQFSDGANR